MPVRASDLVKEEMRLLQESLADLLVATFAAESAPFSATLSESWTRTPLTFTPKGFKLTVQTPFFWAQILDKGRKRVRPVTAKTLLWYKNPLEDDPRLSRGYHRTEAQARSRRLTAAEVEQGRLSGKLIFAKEVGPTKGADFAERARRQFRKDSRQIFYSGLRASLFKQTLPLSGDFRLQVTI